MMTASERAAEKLKDELIQRYLNVGLGYRIIGNIPESGHATFNLELDKEHSGDKVVESHGIRIFIDPENVVLLKDYELDYVDGPDGGFLLRNAKVKVATGSKF
jgi:Fe-S cluster assembly iron-binding protein IscA